MPGHETGGPSRSQCTNNQTGPLGGGRSDRGTVGNLRVSAVINLTGEDEVLRVLSDQLPIKVERMPNGDRRISARNDKGG